MRRYPPAIHTLYAELAEQLELDRLDQLEGRASQAGANSGTYVRKLNRGRYYWYWQTSANGKRTQTYVGPDSPDLQSRIERQRADRGKRADRRAMVSALVAAGMPRPDPLTGAILQALADAGAFRLRAVVVGTFAYQTYAGLLGVRLPSMATRTEDLDLAQDWGISVQIDGTTDLPFQEILRRVDDGFAPVPGLEDGAWRYRLPSGYRVEVLTSARGRRREGTAHLKALSSDAKLMSQFDYLIYKEQAAVVLHDVGVLVNVPAPERFALHKLIVSERRRVAPQSTNRIAKSYKDLLQASSLLEVLGFTQSRELQAAWHDLCSRGPKWRAHALAARAKLAPEIQALFGPIAFDRARTQPALKIEFGEATIIGEDAAGIIRCRLPRSVVRDHFVDTSDLQIMDEVLSQHLPLILERLNDKAIREGFQTATVGGEPIRQLVLEHLDVDDIDVRSNVGGGKRSKP